MSTYEENWDSEVLVTAEAVFGIGFPAQVELEALQAESTKEQPHASAEAAD